MDLVSRATAIVRAPHQEWTVIAAEPTGIVELYTDYIVILALIPLVGEFAQSLWIGQSTGASFRWAASGYVMSMIGVAVIAVLSSKLAPYFGGVDDLNQAFKLSGFSHTPAWLGGVFLLVPRITWLMVLFWLPAIACSLYALYLFYWGIPVLLQVPDRRRVAFVVTLIVAEAVAALVIQFALRLVFGDSVMLLIH